MTRRASIKYTCLVMSLIALSRGVAIAFLMNTGIDTYISSRHPEGIGDGEGCCAGGNVPFDEPLSEWIFMQIDTNQGGTGPVEPLLWFHLDVEPEPGLGTYLRRFAATPNATATLQISITNGADPVTVRRMTVDWLSGTNGDGSNGGNNINRDSLEGVPADDFDSAFVSGVNIEPVADTDPDPAFDDQVTGIVTTDVTQDVAAWAAGVSNFGWGFSPGASQGGLIESFEADFEENWPTLVLLGPDGDELRTAGASVLRPGDADQDFDFDQLDLVQVQIAAKYLTGQPATWGQGDWNGAPGGSPGNPPVGNGLFDQLDIIAALGAGLYLTGPYAAVKPDGQEGDGQTSIAYDASTGEVWVDTPADTELTSINIDSAAGIFTGDAARNLGGSFDNDADNNIFKATFGSSFGPLSFGNVAQVGLTKEFLLGDLSVVGSLAGGGALGEVDLIYVPEPTSALLLSVGLVIGLLHFRRANR